MPKIKGWRKLNDREWMNEYDGNVKVSLTKMANEWRAYLHGKAQDEVIARGKRYDEIRKKAVKWMRKHGKKFEKRQKKRQSGFLDGLGKDLMKI